MKRSLLIITALLIAISFSAFNYYSFEPSSTVCAKEKVTKDKEIPLTNDFLKIIRKETPPDFAYRLGARYFNKVSKSQVHAAKSILDILPEEETADKEDYNSVVVSILLKDFDPTEYGDSETLNEGQLKLLDSTDYSSDLFISSYCQQIMADGEKHEYQIRYYMTVVPDFEATYKEGQDALMEHLKKESAEGANAMNPDDVRPGRLSFIIDTEGGVKSVEFVMTCGNEELDQKFVQLIEQTSGHWNPAKNADGEAVEQQFVFSYGKMGC